MLLKVSDEKGNFKILSYDEFTNDIIVLSQNYPLALENLLQKLRSVSSSVNDFWFLMITYFSIQVFKSSTDSLSC